jgi:hypothetical protein
MIRTLLLLVFGLFMICFTSCIENTYTGEKEYLIAGQEERGAITGSFSGLTIYEEHYLSQIPETIVMDGYPLFVLEKYFTVPHGSYEMYHTQTITTLETTLLFTKSDLPALCLKDDKISLSGPFHPFQHHSFGSLSGESFLVFRFGVDLEYAGWIRIEDSGSMLRLYEFCYYKAGGE